MFFFLKIKIQCLGFIAENGKVWPNQEKITYLKTLIFHQELRRFLGLCNFFSWFIPNYAKLAQNLMKRETKNRFSKP